jgi:hypothetical protein
MEAPASTGHLRVRRLDDEPERGDLGPGVGLLAALVVVLGVPNRGGPPPRRETVAGSA